MATISGKFGKIFRRRDGDDRTPPKALYDDLESAHESITRKSSSSKSSLPSRTHLPLNATIFPTERKVSPSSAPRRIPIQKHSTFGPSQCPWSLPNLTHTHTLSKDPVSQYAHPFTRSADVLGNKSQEPFHSDRHASLLLAPNDRSSIEACSTWQTVISESLDDADQSDKLQQSSQGIGLAGSTRASGDAEFKGSDTVENIYQSYIGRDRSIWQQGTTVENLLPHATKDDVPISKIGSKEGGVASWPLYASPPALQANDEALGNHGGQSFSGYNTNAPRNLHQFAWSPCPSDLDDEDQYQDLPTPNLSGPSMSEHISPGSGEHTSSAASYGNTQKLLELSASQPSNTTSSSRDQKQLSLSSVGTSKAAGDIFLAGIDKTAHLPNPITHQTDRISGIISDGKSSRPMSVAELEESLSVFVQSALRSSTASDISNERTLGVSLAQDRNVVRQAAGVALGQRAGDLAIVLSSSDTQNSYSDPIPSPGSLEMANASAGNRHIRKNTPPGLYGRLPRASTATQSQPVHLPTLHVSQTTGLRDCDRSQRTSDIPSDQDWITELDSNIDRPLHGGQQLDKLTTRYVGRDTDSEFTRASTSNSSGRTGKKRAHGYLQHPRYNDSWSIVRNLKTDSLTMFRDYVSRDGNRIPNSHTIFHAQKLGQPGYRGHYQHPEPLPKQHPHPLDSPLRMTPSCIDITHKPGTPIVKIPVNRASSTIADTEFSNDSNESEPPIQARERLSTLAGLFGGHTSKASKVEGLTASRQPSSLWLSTVAEGLDDRPSSEPRVSSFAKTAILGLKGNLTGTPEGTGAREVGSSLAGESSPETVSSLTRSSLVFGDVGFSPTGDSAIKAFHQQLERSPVDQNTKTTYKLESLENPTRHGWRDTKRRNGLLRTRRKPAEGQQYCNDDMERKGHHTRGRRFLWPSERRYPRITHAMPLESTRMKAQSKRVDWQAYLPAHGQNLSVTRDRSVFQPNRENQRRDIPYVKTSGREEERQNTHQERRSATDFSHARRVSGTDLRDTDDALLKTVTGDWESLNRARYGLPESRDSLRWSRQGLSLDVNPRLYDHVTTPSAMMKARQKHFSRLWASLCVALPFLGPLYGHGYLDRIMAWHCEGAIDAFRRQEKLAVLFYSYLVFAGSLVALSITMVVISK